MLGKTSHPIARAAFGVAALVAIAVLANWLVLLTPAGSRGVDFTQDKIHTLSEGTREILAHLDTPVVARYYASRSSDYMPESLKLHMRRVDDILKEYAALSKGKLRVEQLDPQPDTDAEDSANLDGIDGQRINDQNLYFGLAISCLDKTSVLPFLNPQEETILEYQLSKSIADVSSAEKPVVGLLTPLNIGGSPAQKIGQRPTSPWILYQQLKQSYDLRVISPNVKALDPKEIKVLLLIHPAGISPEVEFVLDQYVLGGGTIVACLDPFSITAQMMSPMSQITGEGVPASSTLPTLLPAWGVNFDAAKVIADPVYATLVNDRDRSVAVLTLPQEAMPQKDNVITKGISAVTFLLPGGFTKTGNSSVAINTLVQTTSDAGLAGSTAASKLDKNVETTLKPSGPYGLVTHLSGTFHTAFPDGRPVAKEEKTAPETVKNPEELPALKTGTTPGNVFLIGDVDAFYDQFAYTVQEYGGRNMAGPANGNSSLLFNLLDQATGSKYLIGSRSRAAIRRPFTVVQKMESAFTQNVGSKITEFQAKQQAAQQKLSSLQTKRSQSGELHLSPEQEAEIRKLRQEQVDYARMVRDEEKGLRRQKDALGAKVTLLNVAVMPSLVGLAGSAIFFHRRRATRAR